MMQVTVDDFTKKTAAELAKGMAKAGIYLTSQYRKYLNVAQPYTRAGKKLIGHDPSAPGQFPKKLSGQLQKSITWAVDKQRLTLTVGSTLAGYPKYLETGTMLMAKRPWLSLGWAAAGEKATKMIVK